MDVGPMLGASSPGPAATFVRDWLFLVVFGPLVIASLAFCRNRSWYRRVGRPPYLDLLDPADRPGFRRFLRSREPLPEPRLIPVAVAWAEGALSLPEPCRWDRYLGWAWVTWIAVTTAGEVAFGTARGISFRLILVDIVLLFVALGQWVRRRAHEILIAAREVRAAVSG